MKKIFFFLLLLSLFCCMFAFNVFAETTCTEHDYELTITKERSCDESGELTYSCKVCSFVKTEVLAPACSYKTFVIVKEANCKNNTTGILRYTCQFCNNTMDEEIPVGHKYHSKVTKVADCYNSGTIEHTCEFCGDTYNETTDPVHTYVAQVITAQPVKTVV